MKKCTSAFIVILLLCSNLLWAEAIPDRTIKIAGDNNYPPYEFVDQNGEFKGFNVDIMRAISIEMGFDIDFIPVEWSEAINLLDNNEVDLIQGMTWSQQRQQRYNLSQPLLQNEQVIFVRQETVIRAT